jgi:hypothetical protein
MSKLDNALRNSGAGLVLGGWGAVFAIDVLGIRPLAAMVVVGVLGIGMCATDLWLRRLGREMRSLSRLRRLRREMRSLSRAKR